MNNPQKISRELECLEKAGLHIETVQYHHFPGTDTTICCIKFKSGFCATGHSATFDYAQFNAEMGEFYAYANALNAASDYAACLIMQHAMKNSVGAA